MNEGDNNKIGTIIPQLYVCNRIKRMTNNRKITFLNL